MKRLLTLLCLLLGTGMLSASEIKTGEDVTIDERSTENLYLFGGHININNTVEGDLLAAGGEIHLRDTLLDDCILAGGSLNIDAVCADDLRAIGGEIIISKDVQGDLVITAGEIEIEESVTIHGDLIILGGEVEVYGSIAGDVRVTGGEVELNGPISGRLDARAGELNIDTEINGLSTLSAIEINLGSDAYFKNDVSYWSKEEAPDFEDALAPGVKARYDDNLKSEIMDIDWEASIKKGVVAWSGFRLISGLFLTFVLFFFLGNYYERNAGLVSQSTGSVLGSGVVTLIGLPILSVFAFATVIGIPIGVISSSLFVIALTSSNALAAIMGAYEIQHLQDQDWSKGKLLVVSLGLFIGLRLLGFIPALGGLVSFIAGAIAIGYIITTIRQKKVKAEPTNDSEDLV